MVDVGSDGREAFFQCRDFLIAFQMLRIILQSLELLLARAHQLLAFQFIHAGVSIVVFIFIRRVLRRTSLATPALRSRRLLLARLVVIPSLRTFAQRLEQVVAATHEMNGIGNRSRSSSTGRLALRTRVVFLLGISVPLAFL